MLTPCMEILPPAQLELWPYLRPAADMGYVLYGGTAIALRIGHRTSVDFDFFTDAPLDKDALHRNFPFLQNSLVLSDQPDTFTASVQGVTAPVKVSFFGGLSFGRIGAPDRTDDGVLMVATLDDLMAQKAKVILQRVEAKDYQDIAAMVRHGVSLERGLAAAQEMFPGRFQPSEALKAMVYFQGGDLDRLSADDRRTLVTAVAAVRELPRITILDRHLGVGAALDRSASDGIALIMDARTSGDVVKIMSVERQFLERDAATSTDPAVIARVQTALAGLTEAELTVALSQDTTAYRAAYGDVRTGALPKDPARLFFASHAASLINWPRDGLDQSQRDLLEPRKNNMRKAESIYAGMQRQALGIEAPAQQRGKGLEL